MTRGAMLILLLLCASALSGEATPVSPATTPAVDAPKTTPTTETATPSNKPETKDATTTPAATPGTPFTAPVTPAKTLATPATTPGTPAAAPGTPAVGTTPAPAGPTAPPVFTPPVFTPRASSTPPPGWDRYKILVERNVFSKTRTRGRYEDRPAEVQEKPAAPPPTPERDFQLRGIVQKDGQLVAFIENAAAKTIQPLRTGESIARGKVGAITLDNIEYVCDDQPIVVSVGQTLEGAAAVAPASVPAGRDAGTTGPAASTGSPEVDSIVERLRKRRQEEMRK
ncbi:MAG TPA: hypothetical protein VGP72_10625 [Planctomycetota bacterium]|jgi:hypothetical protein